jgi:hypothetical protein
MHHSITILLSALAIAAASPTLPPRACTTIYPTDLQSLVNALPDTSFFNQAPPDIAGGVGGMTIQQDNTDGTVLTFPHLRVYRQPIIESSPQLNLQFVDFVVPAGSYGCELMITDQANQLYYESDGDTSAAPPALNIISLLPNSVGDPTYDNIMNANPSIISSYNWGTVTLAHGGSAVINSVACPNATSDGEDGHAQYVFEFAQAGPGYSDWVLPQLVPEAGVQLLNGVYMTFNC